MREEASIRGSVLLARLTQLRKVGGEELVGKVTARLPTADQTTLRGMLLPVVWYPFALNARLDDAIAEVLSPKDRERAFREMGKVSAEENLGGAQKIFLKPGNPQAFLAQSSSIFRTYYAMGSRTYEKTGERSGIIKTFDADAVSVNDCMTNMGWHERALELCGAKNPRLTHPICRAQGGKHCEYHVAWDP